MPATYAHNRFGKDVYNKSNKSIKNSINDSMPYYELFCQSFDNLFFYSAFNFIYGKDIRNLGHFAHKNNVNLYFKNIIDYIKNNNLYNNSYLLSYLYGSINHYILDSTMHPYIFYKTGAYYKDRKETHKYNGLHTKFEFMLDAFLYNYDTNLNYKYFDVDKKLFYKLKFPDQLIKTIDNVFFNTFKIENIGKKFNKSYNDYRLTYKYGFIDKYNIKKYIFNIIDKVSGDKIKNIRYYTTNIDNIEPEILNLDKKNWYHSCDKSISSNKSFFELYEDAVNKSVDIIKKIDLYFKGKYDYEKLLLEIGNSSYSTGLSLDNNKKHKYFEF